ncbi:hypothetical protein J4219_02665 [Candidatus Woesearchaeota archaeon]|nr:hypothetical protein [Candidatus Woesearchaeota archaeon]
MIGIVVAGTALAVALHQFCGINDNRCRCGVCEDCKKSDLNESLVSICQWETIAGRRAGDWHRYEFMRSVNKEISTLDLEGLKRAHELVNAYVQAFGKGLNGG